MTRTAKILLALGTVFLLVGGALNLGWIQSHGPAALYIIFPVGAVFLGLFLIELLLQKQDGSHPEDQHLSEPSSAEPGKDAPPQG